MSAGTRIATTRIAEIVGDANYSADPAHLAAYEIDGVRPAAAARPANADGISEIIKVGAAEKLAIIPCGARTKLAIGSPPRKYDVALDLTRLDRVISYDPGDLTLSVEAGISLRKLADVLAEQRQFLPLAVPFFSHATIGGTVASGVDSPLRQLYGTARDYVLGIEFVTGAGAIAKSGGLVVKNVTGFDLHKLMIGSLGTLGIMTKVNFRTFPLPLGTRALVANFKDGHGALDMRSRVAQSALRPLTMELLSPGVAHLFYSDQAAQREPKPLPSALLTGDTWAFTAGFAGTDEILDRCETDFRKFARESGALAITTLSAEQIPGAFGRKREFIPIALASSPATTILKIGILPSKLHEVFAEIQSAADADSLRHAVLARGLGIVYAALMPQSKDDTSRATIARVIGRIQSACTRLEGHATIPWCPSEWKPHLSIWGPERGDLPQMRKLKTIFDPHGILSPGRFVGGI